MNAPKMWAKGKKGAKLLIQVKKNCVCILSVTFQLSHFTSEKKNLTQLNSVTFE